ncbi:GGDEF domain-containing protein [Hippea maritima]|uniref:diguanylate cyclase n=1 Tax=Hippea maritima (strain ATCC 700847 / DSM 10411 / MH2) TaxID=760142 RepID=F2LV59_HIPMA|nr:GGDEF domain-containing protein [Hippea maritima]AEA33643.1 diguanylate cyclase [Hippea maritima DSM 10411]
MILQKILAESESPSDVLQIFVYDLTARTGSRGGFVCTETTDYMDAVIGSMRRRRSSLAKDGISVSNIKPLEKGESFVFDTIFIYRTSLGWYVGLDDPEIDEDHVVRTVERTMDVVYPAYSLLLKHEDENRDKDELTGCFTRRELFRHLRSNLKTMLTKDIPLYVFYMDFNNFKVVNDTLGHHMGDAVLRSIASEIKSIFLGYGNVYRVGGDEFIGVAFGINEELANRIAKRIEAVTRQAPCGLFVSVSVAYKVFDRNTYSYTEESNMDTVLNRYLSDIEVDMYENKKKIRDAHEIPKIICGLCPYCKS